MPTLSAPLLTLDTFTDLARELRSVREATTVQLPSPENVLSGVPLVREGLVVALGEGPSEPSQVLETRTSGVPQPYALSDWTESDGGWAARNHRFEIDVHGATSMTHIDALDHFAWDEMDPILGGALGQLSRGLVTRGVLLDVPAFTGEPIAPAHVITLDEARGALDRQGISLRPGDALYVNLGRTGSRRSDVPLGAERAPGLSIECARWLANIGPSVVISDSGLDPDPSEVEGIPVPWHVMLLTVLGIPLVDMAQIDLLAATCRRLNRWEFLSTIAPLPIPHSSGSPVNPLAVF